ncbi:MAG: hypothetical protein E6J57_08560, partial [Deltaproteobacteria bacterium]
MPPPRASRSARRRAEARPAAPAVRLALLRAVTLPRVLAALWLAATAELLVLTALVVHHYTTWYLAIDQFG